MFIYADELVSVRVTFLALMCPIKIERVDHRDRDKKETHNIEKHSTIIFALWHMSQIIITGESIEFANTLKCRYRANMTKPSLLHGSISSTFYADIFCTRVGPKPNYMQKKAAQKTFIQKICK